MTSTSKCPSCGGNVGSNERNCPHCGASNADFVADAPGHVLLPRTIEELKAFCAQRGIRPERLRFFIGQNCTEPRAYGIYRDGDRFIVYKNKTDGTRAVRYAGSDEARAVGELYGKLMVVSRTQGA